MSCKEMSGIRFGKLLVIGRSKSKKDGTAVWKCLCDCGTEKIVVGTSLRAGRHKSCGCSSPRFTKERVTTHGKSRTKTYTIWSGMKKRCSSVAIGKSKRLYFDKGIRVCEKWLNFENFLQDMGDCPDGCSIDRIDGDKGYEPSNCRWATPQQQANNTSKNVLITYSNKTQTISQWAREIGIKTNTLVYRLKRGWDVPRALTSSPLELNSTHRVNT